MRGEFRDRDAEEIAGVLTQLGVPRTKEEVKEFFNDSLDTAQRYVLSRDFERDLEGFERDLKRDERDLER